MPRPSCLIGLSACLLFASAAHAQFVQFTDETATRLSLGPISVNDTLEKDIAVGDFDRDGLDDAVVVRKTRFSNPGAQTDVLLMNRGGVLVNATAALAPQFLTNPTDARDVRVADVDMDGWDDLVICNTFGEQPLVYMNMGEDGNGDWLGFEDDSSRIPTLSTLGPLQFCAVWSGDLTGNGAPDLYFANYNPGGPCTDVLLINDGAGNFTDETDERMSSSAFGDYSRSAFGTDVEFHDIDGDGDLDILKLSTLFNVSPFDDRGVFVLFNDGNGFFNTRPFQEISDRFDPYMFEGCDLNNDGMLDIFVVTDSDDTYRLQTSATTDGPVTYGSQQSPTSNALGFFGGNVHVADLDGDGDLDVMVSPIDTDIANCETGGRVVLLENTGLASGNLVDADPSGTEPWSQEAFDFEFLDVNNDGALDVLLGNCGGYSLIIQQSDLCPGDCNQSGGVDFADLTCMLFEFGNPTAPLADCDGSGTVDFGDLTCALFLFGPCP